MSTPTSLLSLVLPDAEDDPDLEAFVVSLTDQPLERLLREPGRLASEKARAQQGIEDVAFANYNVFIDTAEAARSIHEQVHAIDGRLDKLLERVPRFAAQADEFTRNAAEIAARRKALHTTLQMHTQVLELLEVPQLMDTCVRGAYYDEALQLEAFASQLARQFPSLDLVQDVARDVRASSKVMHQQLMQVLTTNVQLPACLRVIGYLRRINVYTEAELRACFLRSRDVWIASVHAKIPSLQQDAVASISKLAEHSRVQLFDVVTQYRAIFTDDDTGLLYSWLLRKVSAFLGHLEAALAVIKDGSAMHSVLDQSMYFAMSLGRVGADFRALLVPMFEHAVVQRMWREPVAAITASFKEELQQYTWLRTTPASLSNANQDASSPPAVLLEHALLATMTNRYLAVFNELRHCLPAALQSGLAADLTRVFDDMAAELATYRASSNLNDNEEVVFRAFCRVMAEHMHPYLARCLESMFAATDALVHRTGSQATLQRLYQPQDPAAAAAAALNGVHATQPDDPAAASPAASAAGILGADGGDTSGIAATVDSDPGVAPSAADKVAAAAAPANASAGQDVPLSPE